MPAFVDTQPNRLADRLLSDRHPVPLSVLLHLAPGALIVAAYLLIGEPLVDAIDYPHFAGWAIALCTVLLPILAGLLWLGYRHNGRLALHGVLHYTGRPVPRGKLVTMVVPLILWMITLGYTLAPVNTFFLDHLFTWLPYTDASSNGTNAYLHGYSHSTTLTTMLICLSLTGFALPLIEELYFRGFLLPRIAHLGRRAPAINTILFSLYHLWSPWAFLSRVLFTFPGYWLAWRHRDIRVSIGMHVGSVTILATLGTLALALNLI